MSLHPPDPTPAEQRIATEPLTPAQQDRRKWNARFRGAAENPKRPVAHPMAERWRGRFIGGPMLDAACGLGRGLAGGLDHFAPVYAVDVSDVGIAAARKFWPQPGIRWVVADVTALPWPQDHFGLVCSLRFTDVGFLRGIRAAIRPGGMLLFEGFSSRQFAASPKLNPDWVMSPDKFRDLFAGWEILEIGESDEPGHALIHAAAIRPARP
jgi:tellurite methyltransferase